MVYTEKEPGRSHMKATKAAEELGVGVELLQGLIRGGQVAGFESTGRSGHPIWFIYKDEVARFRAELSR